MKNLSLVTCLTVLFITSVPVHALAAGKINVDPCGLMPFNEVADAFPVVKKTSHRNYGTGKACNYLNKRGFTALMVSIGQDSKSSAREMMSNLGDGYTVKDVSGLGYEAAMAVTEPDPQLAIPGGLVTELYIKKGNSYLLLAPVSIQIKDSGPEFEKLLSVARGMLKNLP